MLRVAAIPRRPERHTPVAYLEPSHFAISPQFNNDCNAIHYARNDIKLFTKQSGELYAGTTSSVVAWRAFMAHNDEFDRSQLIL